MKKERFYAALAGIMSCVLLIVLVRVVSIKDGIAAATTPLAFMAVGMFAGAMWGVFMSVLLERLLRRWADDLEATKSSHWDRETLKKYGTEACALADELGVAPAMIVEQYRGRRG